MGKLSKQYMFLLLFESGSGGVEIFHITRFFYIANTYQSRTPYRSSLKHFFTSSDVSGFSLKLPSVSLAEAVASDM